MQRGILRLSPIACLVLSAAAAADLNDSDQELIDHIRANDYVLSRVLVNCGSQRIERDRRDGIAWFSFSASCAAPPPEDDCPSYRVTAAGTVDRADIATVRDLRMELVCTD